MASGFQQVPTNSQKHDPAWKHCQMYKHGDRVHLKCLYCAKIFRGGGIHRFKEHLACQKGNASTCYRVPMDVRQAMQQSLDCVTVKKKKKQKIADDVDGNGTSSVVIPMSNEDDDVDVDGYGVGNDVHMISNGNGIDGGSTLLSSHDDGGLVVGVLKKRKRGRPSKNVLGSQDVNDDIVGVGDGHVVPLNGMGVPLKRVNSRSQSQSQVQLAIGRFMYDVGVSLDAVNSVYFQPMIDAIASEGTGLVGPSSHDLRGWILKSVVDEVRADMDYCGRAWVRNGCSVLVEECSLEKGMKCLNFLVYCPEGTMFYKSVNVTSIVGSNEGIFELIKHVVEELGVKNVLQLITPNEECYAFAGKRLSDAYPSLYWAPCAASSIILMLEDFGKFEWINSTLEQCKSITRFIYNHSVVLNMLRRYTIGTDLVVPDVSPVVTSFRTVKRMVDLKHNLEVMVTSQEWVDSHYSKQDGGLSTLDFISDHSFWTSCNMIARITDPFLRALNLVSIDKKPAMGYIYAAMYRAKETLKREVRKREDYLAYWNIIDQRWEQHQHLPLYAAGFYLNPKFFYSIEGDLPGTIVSGMFDCIERLVPDTKIQDKISKELNLYKVAAGDFGRKMAVRARESLLPSEWWSTYGGSCPNLSRLAVSILGQCCSIVSCKQDSIPLLQMHKTTNSLEHQRLSDQVFTQYNLRLRQMIQKNKEHDDMDPLLVDNCDSATEWIARKEICLDDPASFDWLAVNPPSSGKMLLKASVNDVEQLGGGFDDDDILSGIKDEEV